MNILDRADLVQAKIFFEIACAASRKHSALAARSLEEHGDHGADISGCVRDHFPEHIKEELRRLAKCVTFNSTMGHECRPSRVRVATMRKLASAVATRDGSGFYGPQPFVEHKSLANVN